MVFNYPNNSKRSANHQHSGKTLTPPSEVQWVSFPPLPEAALHPFSSAVQFVSTTLKPLTEPSISYPAGPLPSRLSRANGLLSSSSRVTNFPSPLSPLRPAPHNSNGSLKRSRTTTSSTIPTSVSRKRSKSDFGSNDRQRHRPCPADLQTPAMLIRQRQRLSESTSDKSGRRKHNHVSPYPQYMNAAARSTASLKSTASVNSMRTLYPTRSRAHSQLSARTSGLKEEINQIGPVRTTYLGGVGVYLNHDQSEHESIQEEKDWLFADKINDCKSKPKLTIDVGLSNGLESLKNTGSWYNRLLLSPLTSASSSVMSFFVSSSSPAVSSDGPDGSSDGTSEEELGNSPPPVKAVRSRAQK